MLIEGIYVPLTAPFRRDGESFLNKLEYNVGRYSLGPAAGLVALTAACEGGTLSDDETRETLHVIGQVAAKEKVLIAAIAKESVRGALALAEQSAASGFDAVLLAAPMGWQRMSREEVMLYFRAVADRAALPVLLSSETGAAGFALSLNEIAELAQHWNVIGLYDEELTVERYHAISSATKHVKHEVAVTTVFAPVTRRMQTNVETAGGVSLVAAEALAGGKAIASSPIAPAVKTRLKTVGFQLMAAGRAMGFVELLEAGVSGGMLTLSACAPQGCHETYAAFKDGDAALAAEKEHRLIEADAAIAELGIAAVKYGCDLNGYYGGVPRLPRLALGSEDRGVVERLLAAIRA